MSNPVLVEILRGEHVESAHRGAIAVCDGAGKLLVEIGDVSQPVFPRSAVKAIQALPLVESGAADAFGFGDRELALACASHKGESAHVDLAASMLARIGLDETALECGAHWPLAHEATVVLARSGRSPSQLHNNCSGKHSGFLCACRHMNLAHQGYVSFEHPYQATIREVMKNVTGAPHDADNSATDGCSIPTYAIPISSLALGFARLATGQGLSTARAKAAKRLVAACMAEPFLVSGSQAADLALMQAAPGSIFVKTGAEGVYCAALPELGLGIALKCDDGAGRAAEAMVAAVLAMLLKSDEALSERLAVLARPAVPSRKGEPVGRVQPTEAISGQLT
ncbi:asparaginase [Mesorhizobium sp. KR9-304]|uniref:asparaginase n=1 Tax=Mesorhizobium sp. KR9-304 TaxID=3156614 RepID=UPI0032B5B972